MVFNGEGDEEFIQALLQGEDNLRTGYNKDMTPSLKASQLCEGNKPRESDRQFKLKLDGFTIGLDGGTKRHNETILDDGIDMKDLEAKRKKKAGIYDLEPVDKLKVKGYNLFLDITEAYGQASEYMMRQNTNKSNSSSGGQRQQRKLDSTLPAIPRSLMRVVESVLKKDKKT